ncbi:hypothetical protein RB7594 [Rhodopirellula baltica SH 1]|uniref:Uncharacterized protein n=1 Tax=Rhodopirellula baltica (strain DSM 10527 / NCIMB 13988 / SH1) TaxID=243090 RepID=Q7UNG4_RHOBA|nr:hypothetical protein RB7594 [Rhodopirellula baltica SH 1]
MSASQHFCVKFCSLMGLVDSEWPTGAGIRLGKFTRSSRHRFVRGGQSSGTETFATCRFFDSHDATSDETQLRAMLPECREPRIWAGKVQGSWTSIAVPFCRIGKTA